MFWKFFDLQKILDELFDGSWMSLGISGSSSTRSLNHEATPQLAQD
jgi:hypothetical protein